MDTVDWSSLIAELEGRGLSLGEIADAVGAHISTISDIKQGRTKEPRGNVALKLHALYTRRKKAA